MNFIKSIFSLLFIAALFLTSGCGGSEEGAVTPTNEAPGTFSASVKNITLTSATVEWTPSIDPDGDAVTYSITINGSTLESGITSTSVEITGLDEETQYSGSVTASDGNGGTTSATFSFVTNGNQNPETFAVTVSNIAMTSADLNWSTSTDPDGDNVIYTIKLDGSEVAADLETTSFSLTDLTEETAYSGTVEASDGNGGMSSASFSFTTAANELPSAFTVTVSDITDEGAVLTWTSSTDPEGNTISYSVGLEGSEVAANISALTYSLTGLSEGTTYHGAVLANDGDGGITESMFDFTTESVIVSCPNDNSIDQNNRTCTQTPGSNTYDDNTINFEGDREIVTNGIPTHDYNNQIPEIVMNLDNSTKTYYVDNSPSKAASVTTIAGNDGHPQWKFGVAKNGVAVDPAPAEPFIFENTSTGEYNWDWVMEPNNNMNDVGLDCAIAHVQPDGLYHYHGDMAIYAEELSSGISTGTAPTNPVQIGWAADGFPILYYYGPTSGGSSVELLSSSYQLKSGDRTGDGVSEPCGEYNGKYTNDYEYVSGSGDLDECNGIDRSVTLSTGTYSYFYVITAEFPVISRCIVGTPDDSFKIGM